MEEHTGKVDPGLRTRDPGPSTWDPSPGTYDPGPRQDPGPVTWDPICRTEYGTGTKYLYLERATHILIQT